MRAAIPTLPYPRTQAAARRAILGFVRAIICVCARTLGLDLSLEYGLYRIQYTMELPFGCEYEVRGCDLYSESQQVLVFTQRPTETIIANGYRRLP